jgi:hypothetical protein
LNYVLRRHWRNNITAEVDILDGGAEGVLLAQGGIAGDFVLYVKENKLHYIHNYLGFEEFTVNSSVVMPECETTLRYEFEPTGEPDPSIGRGAAVIRPLRGI